jgi:hypothetical protein
MLNLAAECADRARLPLSLSLFLSLSLTLRRSAYRNVLIRLRGGHISQSNWLTIGRLEVKTDQNQENRKPIFLKTDRRSVFGLL